MKIVVLDGYTENPGDLSWDALAALGDLTVYDRTPYEDAEIIRRIGDAQIVYTNKTPVSRAAIEACPQLEMIGVLATGYNVVDVAAAREKGIPVCNIPTYGTDAVGAVCHRPAPGDMSSRRPSQTRLCMKVAGRAIPTGASGICR